MMLDSVDNGPLVYLTVKENRQTRPKKYSKLTEAQQLQDDCDVQVTNIIFHCLPPDVYALVNHQEVAKDIWDRVKLLMKGTELSYKERELTQQSQAKFPQLDSGLAVPTFQQGEDPIDCINKAMAFQSAMASSVIAKEHNVISVIDGEETLILEEESRSKMLDKQNDPILIKQKINTSQIDYSKLNKIKEAFDKCFVTQKELFAEQAFWLKHMNYNPKTSVKSHTHVRIEAPSELPKDTVIRKLKDRIKSLSGKDSVENVKKDIDEIETINIELEHSVELLVYVSKTCLSLTKPCEKLVVFIPMNKDKKVRFVEPITSSNNILKQTGSLRTKDSNKPLSTSIGVHTTTSASGSNPSGNTKKNRVSRPPSSNQKNKVEEHPRKVKSSLNKTNSISKPISNAHVKHSVRNAKFESICAICNKCLFDANHDMYVIDYVNVHSKSKRNKIRKVWKPMGKVFNEIRYSWKHTDADHAGYQDTRNSTSGSMQLLGDRLVSWSSKKQKNATISSANTEYIALHTDIKHHFIKEQVENMVVELYFVKTEYQLADIVNKPLARERLAFLINKLGMRSMSPDTLKKLVDEREE
uniref:Retrovirus-related Pol polyprotein from transposon TNT 1-94 n=1 Tax=Tanacetum cinerariifolium TaxID=118510 RepID=A0A6L2LR93_TANCI|nr:hypothetical protein [Tanacetum cinerariifolium]